MHGRSTRCRTHFYTNEHIHAHAGTQSDSDTHTHTHTETSIRVVAVSFSLCSSVSTIQSAVGFASAKLQAPFASLINGS